MRALRIVLFSSLLLLRLIASGQETITHCAQVRALTREQAAQRRPVTVRGVVTFVLGPSGRRAMVLQDQSDAIYISLNPPDAVAEFGFGDERTLRPGMELSVHGVTGPGGFAPVIIASSITLLGTGELPPARPQTLTQLRDGALDCARVEMRGIAQRVERTAGPAGKLRILLATPEGSFSAFVSDVGTLDPKRLVDTELQLTGICLTYFSPRGEAVGVHLQVPDPESITVLQPAAQDPFAVPEVSPLALRPFDRTSPNLHRQRLRGIVTLARPGEFLYVQMPQRGVRVNLRSPEVFSPGDLVEAAGFVGSTQSFASLSDALVRRIGRSAIPAPQAITRAQVLGVPSLRGDLLRQEDYDGTLVALRGRLVKIESNPGEAHRIFLDCDGTVTVATLGSQIPTLALNRIALGSELEAVGICSVRLSAPWPALEMPVPADLTLLLQGPESLHLLRAPSWWNPQRLWTALSLTGGILLLSLAWVGTLRRRVDSRSAALADEMRARRDAAVEFETTLRERTRLAADLHDTLEQSLTGLALQLEAAADLQTEAPSQSGQHLGLARQLLDRSREDVRRSVWELRTNPLDGHTLAEALCSIATDRSLGLPVRITVESEGEPLELPDFVASNLLLLTHEGITNALKHAAPRHIALRLVFFAREVILSIRDDGRGFDVARAPGPRKGHFGLQGMRERAKRVGGALRVESTPGHGTTIAIQVPAGSRAI